MTALFSTTHSGSKAREIPLEAARHVALPLGGIGTGNVALCADGALRQWQLHNMGNHRGELPGSFFALRVSQWEPPFNAVRVLQAPPDDPRETATELVNDDLVPTWQRNLLKEHEGVESTTFTGNYPFAKVDYHDHSLPVKVSLEAFTPLVPLDIERSSTPGAMFTFTITNTDTIPVHGWIGAGLQNAVGWDGVINPDGIRHPGYGGNMNTVTSLDGWRALVFENHSLAAGHPGAGSMALSCDAPQTTALPHFTSPTQLLDFLSSRQPFGPGDWTHMPAGMADPQPTGIWTEAAAPSPAGSTYNGALAGGFSAEPGETVTVRFVLGWHFPNRYVNFTQFGGIRPEWGATRYLLGNRYATRYRNASDAVIDLQRNWCELEDLSRDWSSTLTESSLGPVAAEHMAAQAATVRSPTIFSDADGHYFGFEGVHGASTLMWSGDVGGCCPLNCTHVYNYAAAIAHLFPQIERDMRECEFDIMQAPEGFIPHRLISPTFLPQLWDREIGGPGEPALDGMLGSVLKSYREVRGGAGSVWLERYWPGIDKLLGYVTDKWDGGNTGMLHGIQPSTHDIDLAGLNTFMGTLYLAALRAGEEMARLGGHAHRACDLRARFEKSSRAYDEALFNGEYYIQILEDGDPRQFQWQTGCLSDQLFGQWWAHQLGLGYLLPKEHVRSALAAVVAHNLRTDFTDFENPYRVFASGKETGLLVCTWPAGGRPEVPTRYCDEVWTGVENQVGAHLLYEGMTAEADRVLSGLWQRYDGRRRNPYNQVECGDHYARSLAGWTVLEAATGASWDAPSKSLEINTPPANGSYPILTDSGWGTVGESSGEVSLTCRFGHFDIDHIALDGEAARPVHIRIGRQEVARLN